MGTNWCSQSASKSSGDSQDFGDVNMVLKMAHFHKSSRPQWVNAPWGWHWGMGMGGWGQKSQDFQLRYYFPLQQDEWYILWAKWHTHVFALCFCFCTLCFCLYVFVFMLFICVDIGIFKKSNSSLLNTKDGTYLWKHHTHSLNSSPPGQDGRHFGRRHFQMHFLEWKNTNCD